MVLLNKQANLSWILPSSGNLKATGHCEYLIIRDCAKYEVHQIGNQEKHYSSITKIEMRSTHQTKQFNDCSTLQEHLLLYYNLVTSTPSSTIYELTPNMPSPANIDFDLIICRS